MSYKPLNWNIVLFQWYRDIYILNDQKPDEKLLWALYSTVASQDLKKKENEMDVRFHCHKMIS